MGKRSRRKVIRNELQKAFHWLYEESISFKRTKKQRLQASSVIHKLKRFTAIRPKQKNDYNICGHCGTIGSKRRVRIRNKKITLTCQSCGYVIRRVINH